MAKQCNISLGTKTLDRVDYLYNCLFFIFKRLTKAKKTLSSEKLRYKIDIQTLLEEHLNELPYSAIY